MNISCTNLFVSVTGLCTVLLRSNTKAAHPSLYKENKMRPLFYNTFFILFVSVKGFGYYKNFNIDTTTYPAKANTIQVANYTPKKAKDGKDGDQRFAIMLIRGAKHGNNGKDGKPGPDLTVNISTVVISGSVILKVAINVPGKKIHTDTFYVHPINGRLRIIADGGDAGSGGDGERGLEEDGKKSATSGGDAGKGGNGGDGGNIRVIFDSTAIVYANCDCLLFSNEGGRGGSGGRGGHGVQGNPDGSNGNDGNNGVKVSAVHFENDKGVVIAIK